MVLRCIVFIPVLLALVFVILSTDLINMRIDLRGSSPAVQILATGSTSQSSSAVCSTWLHGTLSTPNCFIPESLCNSWINTI